MFPILMDLLLIVTFLWLSLSMIVRLVEQVHKVNKLKAAAEAYEKEFEKRFENHREDADESIY